MGFILSIRSDVWGLIVFCKTDISRLISDSLTGDQSHGVLSPENSIVHV